MISSRCRGLGHCRSNFLHLYASAPIKIAARTRTAVLKPQNGPSQISICLICNALVTILCKTVCPAMCSMLTFLGHPINKADLLASLQARSFVFARSRSMMILEYTAEASELWESARSTKNMMRARARARIMFFRYTVQLLDPESLEWTLVDSHTQNVGSPFSNTFEEIGLCHKNPNLNHL